MSQTCISFSRGFQRPTSYYPASFDGFDHRASPVGIDPGNLFWDFVPGVLTERARHALDRKKASRRQLTKTQRDRVDDFVAALVDELSDRCQDIADAMAAENGDPQRIVEILFEPAAIVIGENWCADECDFFKVTVAMSRMQRLFRRIVADNPPDVMPDLTRCALLSPAPGEQHSFGLSVVDDALRRAGWEVDCCGCDEADELTRLAAVNNYKVIGISISVGRLVPDLLAIVAKLRDKSLNRSVMLMAGGSLVLDNPQIAIDVGFDMVAADAAEAVSIAELSMVASTARVQVSAAAE